MVFLNFVVPLVGFKVFLLLRERMLERQVERPPVVPLFISLATYGGLLMVVITLLFWRWSNKMKTVFILWHTHQASRQEPDSKLLRAYERSMKRADLRSHNSVRTGTRGLDVTGWDRAAQIHRFGDELEEKIKRSPISLLRIYPRWIAWGRAIVSRHDYSKALQRENVPDKEGN